VGRDVHDAVSPHALRVKKEDKIRDEETYERDKKWKNRRKGQI